MNSIVIIIVNNWPSCNCDGSERHTSESCQDEQLIHPAAPAAPTRMEHLPGWIYMTCPDCSWENGYESLGAAKQGMASHRQWCKRGKGRKAQLFG